MVAVTCTLQLALACFCVYFLVSSYRERGLLVLNIANVAVALILGYALIAASVSIVSPEGTGIMQRASDGDFSAGAIARRFYQSYLFNLCSLGSFILQARNFSRLASESIPLR
jgi:hypothetical protein